jgi:hypothetical protein
MITLANSRSVGNKTDIFTEREYVMLLEMSGVHCRPCQP